MDRPQVTTPGLADLLPSWERSLRAERKSPQTARPRPTVSRDVAWCAVNDLRTALDRTQVQALVADLLDHGAQPETARSRHPTVRR